LKKLGIERRLKEKILTEGEKGGSKVLRGGERGGNYCLPSNKSRGHLVNFKRLTERIRENRE
jgi:hypothetical protein